MKTKKIFQYLLSIIGLFVYFLFSAHFTLAENSTSPVSAELLESGRSTVLNDILAYRNLLGYTPLSNTATANAIAQARADDMAQRHFFSHTDPSSNTYAIYELARNAGYQSALGEVLARSTNFESLRTKVVQAWLNSPTHKKVLQAQGFSEIGIGISYDESKGTWIYVVIFA